MARSPSREIVSLCPPEARQDALALLYRQIEPTLRDLVIAEALCEADRGGLDLSALWIARRAGAIVGVVLTQVLAGGAGAVWPPEIQEGWGRAATAKRLLTAAIAHLQERGCRIAQALIEESAPPRVGLDLIRAGMPRVTELHYLGRETETPIHFPPPRGDMVWQTYTPETAARFCEVLQETYSGSLDMPELSNVRSLDDVIAGHRAAGRFDPTRWLLGTVKGEPDAAAVLLLSEVVDRGVWEVAYLGLTPSARGRGLALAALEHARSLASTHVQRMELAVDRRNQPAVRLYQTARFRPFDVRGVHLVVLKS